MAIHSRSPYRILIIGGSGSGETSTLLDLVKEQDGIAKIYLYAKDLSKPKYEFLIKKRKNAEIKHLNDPDAFIECSNTMDDDYESIDDYNPSRKRKISIVFDDMIADIMSNKIFHTVIKELFIRCRKLNISLAFITQSYSFIPKDARLNWTHYWITKINNKREDLSVKPSTVEQKKYEYSPLGKIFTKGLYKDDQEEGLLKRLKKRYWRRKIFWP